MKIIRNFINIDSVWTQENRFVRSKAKQPETFWFDPNNPMFHGSCTIFNIKYYQPDFVC